MLKTKAILRLATIAVFVALLFSFCSKTPPETTMSHQGVLYDVQTVSETDKLVFRWTDSTGNPLQTFAKFKQELNKEGKELVFATNGGMFAPDFAPQGWYVENGKERQTLDLDSGYGNFYLKPNGVFGISTSGKAFISETNSVQANNIRYATQSGPMLVIDGKIHPAFRKGSSNTYIRSGVGLNKQGVALFVISNKPVNFHDFAVFFRDKLNCANALYLDGAISKMYRKSTGREEDGKFGVMIGLVD